MPRNLLAQIAARAVPFAPFRDVRLIERQAEKLQRKQLLWLLQQAADTEWGRSYGFRDLLAASDPVAAYQRRVPVQRYADFESSIERTRCGAANVLWPGRCRSFGISGGTYSTGKVVPAQPEMLSRTIRSGVAMSINYLAQTGNLSAVTGAILPLTGRLFDAFDYPGTILGNFSGLLTNYKLEKAAMTHKPLPRWFADTTESLYMADWDEKLNRLADVTMKHDVRYVALIPTWGLIFFRKLIERYNQRFQGSAICARDIWPKLQLVVSGGMPLEPYRELLTQIIGPPSVDFLNTYGAMEGGMIAYQTSLNNRAMLLNSHSGNFFEFVRYEDRDRADAERFWVGTIDADRDYVPVISNANGLWAYALGDVVRFSETIPAMLEVVGRTAEILSLHREGLQGELARISLDAACRQSDAQVFQFHVSYSPVDAPSPRSHEWYIEFVREPANASEFERILDEELINSCESYRRVRTHRGLDAPRVLLIPQGGMHSALRRSGRMIDAQTKVPCMSEGRELADALSMEFNDHNLALDSSLHLPAARTRPIITR
jgi:hypothetical protein